MFGLSTEIKERVVSPIFYFGYVQKSFSGHRMDLSKVERLLQRFLSPIFNVEECVNVYALCFEIRTKVLEENFLINTHYGVWGRYIVVLELWVAALGVNGPE